MTSKAASDNAGSTHEQIKEAVRDRYAAAIRQPKGGCCGGGSVVPTSVTRPDLVELAQYAPEQLSQLPADAVENALGCGNPLSFAGVHPGDVILDIGSGAGIDVLLSSKIVGPTGKVIGLDFTPEMIARARENAAKAGANNVEFRLGDAENIPLDSASVDWVISNCVINLAPDKRKVFSEAFRVLRPGGKVSISDIVAGDLPQEVRRSIALWADCVAGAIREEEYLNIMREAGLVDVTVVTHQHYDEASIRAMIEENVPNKADRKLLSQLLERNPDLANTVWSARITARKPA